MIAAAMVVDLAVADPAATTAVYAALVACGPGMLVGFAGAAAHALWSRGLIWPDLHCAFCDGGSGGGDGDDPEPDEPSGGDDLIREIAANLHAHDAAATRV